MLVEYTMSGVLVNFAVLVEYSTNVEVGTGVDTACEEVGVERNGDGMLENSCGVAVGEISNCDDDEADDDELEAEGVGVVSIRIDSGFDVAMKAQVVGYGGCLIVDCSAVVVRWLDIFTALGRSVSDGVTESRVRDGVGVGVGVVQLWKYSQSSASAKGEKVLVSGKYHP